MGGGHGNPLQYSCLENPMDRGAWQDTVHRVQRVGHNWSDLAHTRSKSSPVAQTVKNLPAMQEMQALQVLSLGGIPTPPTPSLAQMREWQPTPVFLPGKSHGRRSLEGYSPQGGKESDMTEMHAKTQGNYLHLHYNWKESIYIVLGTMYNPQLIQSIWGIYVAYISTNYIFLYKWLEHP